MPLATRATTWTGWCGESAGRTSCFSLAIGPFACRPAPAGAPPQRGKWVGSCAICTYILNSPRSLPWASFAIGILSIRFRIHYGDVTRRCRDRGDEMDADFEDEAETTQLEITN